MTSPVMPLARSESRKAAVFPTSWIVTPRRSGAFFSTKLRIFEKPPMPAAASVLMGPAEMQFTRMPLGPKAIRVNAISAGPIKTLAAAGIGGFSKILHFVEKHAPLRRGVTTEEVGNTAAFLLSDLASGITGEVIYVDAGFSTTTAGMEE